MKFALTLKSARARSKLSQSKFAKQLGVPLGTLQGWEQGRREPQGLSLKFIIQQLQIMKTKTLLILLASLIIHYPLSVFSQGFGGSPNGGFLPQNQTVIIQEQKKPDPNLLVKVQIIQPIKEAPKYGNIVYRKVSVEAYEVTTLVKDANRLAQTKVEKTLRATESFDGNGSAALAVPPGNYEICVLLDPPQGRVGTPHAFRKNVTVEGKEKEIQKVLFQVN